MVRRRRSQCPAETTLEVIGGRWKIPILYHLFQGVKRFSELQRAVSGITQKVLTQQLREMVRDGIIHREVYARVPPRVDYSLTLLGESLRPVVAAMCEWGEKFREGQLEAAALDAYVADLAGRQSDL